MDSDQASVVIKSRFPVWRLHSLGPGSISKHVQTHMHACAHVFVYATLKASFTTYNYHHFYFCLNILLCLSYDFPNIRNTAQNELQQQELQVRQSV